MGFRDDGDALLARVEALEREKARLERELAKERADDAEVAKERAALAEVRRETEAREGELRRENKALAEELQRERGPGRLARLGTRIDAWKRSGATPSDRSTWAATYGAAVAATWPIYVSLFPLFVVPALARGGWHWWVALAFAAAAPLVAVVMTAVPWSLGRCRLVTAAGAVGLGIGALAIVLLYVSLIPLWYGRAFKAAFLFVLPLYGFVVLLHLTRAVRLGDVPWFVLPWLFLTFFPGPQHLFLAMFGPAWCWELGGRFVDRDFKILHE